MDTTSFLGLFATVAGLVFFFTSGAFSLLSNTLGVIFQSLGLILIYIGIALVLWSVLGSINIFIESFGRRE